jgi:hypothetical protein
MARVIDTIHRLFPNGTNHGDKGIEYFPMWPPDMFAVAATLVKEAGCYTHPTFGGCGTRGLFSSAKYRKEVDDLATGLASLSLSSADGLKTVKKLQDLWRLLLDSKEVVVCRDTPSSSTLKWWSAAMRMLAIADEASAGIGFLLKSQPQHTKSGLQFSAWITSQHFLAAQGKKTLLPHPTKSLCLMVPFEELSVQPKAITPQVGCTLRSLTHHLALLPPAGEVKTYWLLTPRNLKKHTEEPSGENPDSPGSPLNLLVVPFPYRIDGTSFVPGGSIFNLRGSSNPLAFFTIRQDWLTDITAVKFADFLIKLIEAARWEAPLVHGIVLPELALEENFAIEVAHILASKTKLEFFITGVGANTNDFPINAVYSFLFFENKVFTYWKQLKHHRWKLEKSQISRYNLGNSLSPDTEWWEKININDRSLWFYLVRPGTVVATLICEDLARIDPVQPVLHAIGPNLIIALLMDGPQLQHRWANHYATVLADDPGSAVLVLASYGMVRRYGVPDIDEPCSIGLWRDPVKNETVELNLPRTAHALLLTITSSRKTEYTLDGRSEDGTVKLSLGGIRPITCPSLQAEFGR